MTRWEYKTIQIKTKGWFTTSIDDDAIDPQLNALGREGWELVKVATILTNGWTVGCVFVLKRPLE